MTRLYFIELLKALGACREAVRWLQSVRYRSAEKCWNECQRGDWMIWLARHHPIKQQSKETWLAIALFAANDARASATARLKRARVDTSALEALPVMTDRASCVAVRDELRRLRDADAAADAAAYAAAYANAVAANAYAAYAAAAYAVCSAGPRRRNGDLGAAQKRVLARQADAVRQHIPFASLGL